MSRRKTSPRLLPLIPLLVLAGSCENDDNERSEINVWRVECDRGTLSLQLTGQKLLLAGTNISFTEAECTPSSGSSCTLEYRESPHYESTLDGNGDFDLSGPGIIMSGNLDRSVETGSGSITVSHASGSCACTFSGPWTAVLSCTDMGSECIGASDCPDGETCQCGECAPAG